MLDIITPKAFVCGRVRPYHVMPGRPEVVSLGQWEHNLVMYDWATIISRLALEGNANYKISGMYLEFQNAAAPITAPSFDRSGGIDYYNGLALSADTDYLQVPLSASARDVSDVTLFPGGNVMKFFAQTQGTVGVHGKSFSEADNSTVYGGALVAIPDPADRTQDLVFSRFYFSNGNQQTKLATSQIGVAWEIILQ